MIRSTRRFAAPALVLMLIASVAFAGTTRTQGLIAKGTPFEMPWFECDSGRPGPVVLITGGIHGDEPSGFHAAGQIRHWPVLRGKVIVVPRCNAAGIAAKTRSLPDQARGEGDINRNFPKTGEPNVATGALARELWAFATRTKPTWHLDLHEGYGFRGAGSKSCGSSVIAYPHQQTTAARKMLLEAVNATITDAKKKMVPLGPPVDGSLARACAQRLGARAMILETTTKDLTPEGGKTKYQPLAVRVRQHRVMVHRLLTHLKMVDCGVDVITPERRPGGPAIRVGIYNGSGTGNSTFNNLDKIFERPGGTISEPIGVAEIQADALAQFDVLVFPGGSGSAQARAIGATGRDNVRDFVRDGGGYIGICAGAYLATYRYDWSLGILDAYVIDRKHWARGTGMIKMEMTPAGRKMLGGRDGLMDIHYAQGPLLGRAEIPNLPDFTTLAVYRTEIAKKGAPEGVMINTPAIIAGRYGKGTAIAISPHPEKSTSEKGAHNLLIRALRELSPTRERQPIAGEGG